MVAEVYNNVHGSIVHEDGTWETIQVPNITTWTPALLLGEEEDNEAGLSDVSDPADDRSTDSCGSMNEEMDFVSGIGAAHLIFASN